MATKVTTVRNGSIPLSRELQRSWKGAQVFVSGGRDTILVKRVRSPRRNLGDMLDALKKVGKQISRKDIEEAIRSVRRSRTAAR